MSEFTVTGRFDDKRGTAEFQTTVEAENETVAREHVLSQLGSRHGVKRTQVDIEGVETR